MRLKECKPGNTLAGTNCRSLEWPISGSAGRAVGVSLIHRGKTLGWVVGGQHSQRICERLHQAPGKGVTVAVLLLNAALACAQEEHSNAQGTWEFRVAPYMWAAGQSGSARIGTRIPAQNVDASFSDVFSSLDFGAMAAFEARKDRWRILVDAFYIQLSKNSQPLLGGSTGQRAA
jgi:hypothetical protein